LIGWAKAAWSFFGAWNCGATLFVYDDRGPFDPQRLLGILHRYPITTLCAAPLAYRQIVLRKSIEYYKRNPPSALSHCTAAGEALNDEVIRQFNEVSGIEIHDGYGQTETILLCGNFNGCPIRPGSMGKPAPTVPLHVITSDGKEAAVGEEGDMAVLLSDASGHNGFFGVFDGYIDDDDTLNRREKSFTHNGELRTWYLTGDKAKRDKDGYFWFVGRSDDVINSSGYRIGTFTSLLLSYSKADFVGPFEVESTLKMHPAVEESAVVSSPDTTRGEVVMAYVVLKSEYMDADHATLISELQAFCKANAAPYKYPRKIKFIQSASLPRTVSGKIQRNELRKLEWVDGLKAKL
jgi:medium-chain acyl-CoA synthetase